MKKDQLKKVLKPLIKECIKEAIFEEGVLSGLIKEVALGLGEREKIVEKQEVPQQDFSRQRVELQQEARAAMEEKKRKLEEQLGGGFSGIFENTEPLQRAGTPTPSEGSSQGPLSNYAPHDSGVDISGLMSIGSGRNWKKMI
tara:strand:- start:9 stop:434 length:426 start_codon:yes stop_codon:yes gene_type:complete